MSIAAKKERVELPPPPYVWLSWIVLLVYIMVAVEGLMLFIRYPWQNALSLTDYYPGPVMFKSVTMGQIHLCGIYVFESLMAVGPGWCAMSPGWTLFELFVHHVPYVAAVSLAFIGDHADRWTAPMTMVLLTPLNEGLFIAQSLGAPEGVAKFRRAFGFCAILLLWSCETAIFARNFVLHYQKGWTALPSAAADAAAIGGIYYHLLLLRLYIRRWRKTRSL